MVGAVVLALTVPGATCFLAPLRPSVCASRSLWSRRFVGLQQSTWAQTRPSAAWRMSGGEGTKFACDELPASAVLPSLVVFDLDNTLWTPELYQLRKLPGYQDASGAGPVADKDVKLFPDARDALLELATAERWRDVSLAAASRTNKGPWAKGLLLQFKINGQPLNELMPFQEIYSSDKTRHFQALREKTGVASL